LDYAMAAIKHERKVFGNASMGHEILGAGQVSCGATGQRVRTTGKAMWPTNISWCRGITGFGLSGLAVWQISKDEEEKRELESAISSLLPYGDGFDHSLCHGTAGNLLFLQAASQVLCDSASEQTLKHSLHMLIEEAEYSGLRSGAPNDKCLPGLMTGIAGIGYSLLRLLNPESVPNILVLEGPRL
jgi:lantibiotic modifying enzyme